MSQDCSEVETYKNSTNLSLSEDWEEDIRDVTRDTPRYNKQNTIDGIKGRRLDEHGNDGLVQSVSTCRGPYGTADLPAMEGEPCNDHKREEDVERNGNREVWNAKVDYGRGVEDFTFRLRDLVYEQDTHRCADEISRGRRRQRARTRT